MAVAEIRTKVDGVTIRVASVHLSGGRFTDANFEQYKGDKGIEILTALERAKPDIITGDFNSYNSKDDAKKFQTNYDPFIQATEAGKQNEYLEWAVGGASTIESKGYRQRNDNEESTTIYGGTVDHIYLKNGTDFDFCGETSVQGNFTWSDHRMVISRFSYTTSGKTSKNSKKEEKSKKTK